MTYKEFITKARNHQWKYLQNWRKEYEGNPNIDLYSQNPDSVSYDKRVWLDMKYAADGLVFYKEFRKEILEIPAIAHRCGNKQDKLLSIALRSEHIPYNLFFPLLKQPNDSRTHDIVRTLSGGDDVKEVTAIKIEYAPEPIQKYLNDGTSFDTYIEYVNADNLRCGIGIEVKYTEKEYNVAPSKGKPTPKEWLDTHDANGKAKLSASYQKATLESGYYLTGHEEDLVGNELRQVWRNHILGASMVANGDLDSFKSITIFPNANPHFHKVEPHYRKILTPHGNKTIEFITYETNFDTLNQYFNDSEGRNWTSYLRERYIIDDASMTSNT